jgi:GxxExxY protein
MEFDDLSNKVIGSAIEVHKSLGPGLLESSYERCLSFELSAAGIRHEIQKELPIQYKSLRLDCGYRIDMLVEDKLIVELKSIEKIIPIHEAQLLTYMKLSGVKIGLLINFNVLRLKEGIKRYVL